jgi:hypothetical protein
MDKKLNIELTQEDLDTLADMIQNGKVTLEMSLSAKAPEPRENPALIKRQEAQATQKLKEEKVAAYLLLPENKFWNDCSWKACRTYLNKNKIKTKKADDIILSKGPTTVRFAELNGQSMTSHKAGKPLTTKQVNLVKAFRRDNKVPKKEAKQTNYNYVETDFNSQVFAHLKEAISIAKKNEHNTLVFDNASDTETKTDKIGKVWISDTVNKIVNKQGKKLEFDDELINKADIVIRDYVAAKKTGSSKTFFIPTENGVIYILSDVYDEIINDSYEDIVDNT